MYKVGLFAKNNAANNTVIAFPKDHKLHRLPTAEDVYQLQNTEIVDAQKFKHRVAALIEKPRLKKPRPSLGLFAAPKPKPQPKSNTLEIELKKTPRF